MSIDTYTEHDACPEFVRYVESAAYENKPRWSGKEPPPTVGATVNVKMNSIGPSVVVKFFVEDGFLGLIVRPKAPPAWYVKQNGRDATCHVFGAELGA